MLGLFVDGGLGRRRFHRCYGVDHDILEYDFDFFFLLLFFGLNKVANFFLLDLR